TTLSSVGSRVVLGDEGEIDYGASLNLETVKSIGIEGDNDTITLGGASGDSNIVIGGVGSDNISSTDGNDVIIGDNGLITFTTAGIIETLVVTDLTNGTKDIIRAGNGDNIIAGATGDDEIYAGIGNDIILGDGGSLSFTGGVLTRAESTASTQGNDIIVVLGGDNLILGGAGSDTVTTGDGEDLILGDTGEVVFDAGVLKSVTTSNEGGEADYISTGAGDDIVLAGLGSDVIDTGADNDIVIADTGSIEKNPTGDPATLIKNDVDPALGGDDEIYLGTGDDIALGGAGSDTIYGEEGQDAIFGDFVELNISQAGVRDFQSTLPTFGVTDFISGGDGFDILVGGGGSDFFIGSLSSDIIIGNYGRIQDSNDFTSLLVVSDPSGREIISSSLFDIYGTNNGSGAGEADGLFVEGDGSGVSPLTDSALRLTPLLNGEELSRLSDSELKEFLRNLPLLSVEDSRRTGYQSAAGSSDVPDEPSKTTVPSVEEEEIEPISAFNMPLELNKSQAASDDSLINATQGDITQAQNQYSTSMNASISDTLALGLLGVVNVAGQRGWKLGRLSDEEKVIQGDLEDLRKVQSSRKYSIWQKQDSTENYLN
ncbi:MAG: calcium-binding protein, partial [Nitrosomonadaceae bacterium]